MVFFSSLTGGSQRHDVYEGQKEASAALDSGFNNANKIWNQTANQGMNYLRAGQKQTTVAYNTGRKDINSGADAALGYLGDSNALLQPYAEQGTRANTMYGDAIGVNGADARTTAQGNYLSDPIFAALMEKGNSDIFKKYNAGGMGDSGASRAAVLQSSYDNYSDWLDRLSGQGQQGLQAAGQMGQNNANMATVSTNRGTALAGLDQWQGNNAKDYATAFAGNRVNLGNTVGQGLMDVANTKAGNAISARSALANTRGMGWQNALSLGGTALKATTAFL